MRSRMPQSHPAGALYGTRRAHQTSVGRSSLRTSGTCTGGSKPSGTTVTLCTPKRSIEALVDSDTASTLVAVGAQPLRFQHIAAQQAGRPRGVVRPDLFTRLVDEGHRRHILDPVRLERNGVDRVDDQVETLILPNLVSTMCGPAGTRCSGCHPHDGVNPSTFSAMGTIGNRGGEQRDLVTCAAHRFATCSV